MVFVASALLSVIILGLFGSDAFHSRTLFGVIHQQESSVPATTVPIRRASASNVRKQFEPWVCIVARAPFPPNAKAKAAVMAFLGSIYAQSHQNWDLYLISPMGGRANKSLEREIRSFSNTRMHLGPDSPVRFRSKNGYEATNYALDFLLNRSNMKLFPSMRPERACTYFLFTNADNLYHSAFFETLYPGMQQHLDLLRVGFVTLHARPSQVHDARFNRGHVDLGAALVSEAAISSTGARFDTKDSAADWLFFDTLIQRAHGRVKYYEEVLFFHQ